MTTRRSGRAFPRLAGELVAGVVPLRMAEHYFLMTFPPLAILSARALARVVLDLADTRAGARVFAGIVALVVLTPIMPAMRADAASVFKFADPQRTTSRAIAALLPPDDRSLLVLSYDFMADYLFTRTPLPGRAAIPVHLFGPQTALLGPDPAAAIDALFAGKPRVVLVDTFDLDQLATPEERRAVDRNLACCYRDAVTQREVWATGGRGSYHIADIHLFLRTDGKAPASP